MDVTNEKSIQSSPFPVNKNFENELRLLVTEWNEAERQKMMRKLAQEVAETQVARKRSAKTLRAAILSVLGFAVEADWFKYTEYSNEAYLPIGDLDVKYSSPSVLYVTPPDGQSTFVQNRQQFAAAIACEFIDKDDDDA